MPDTPKINGRLPLKFNGSIVPLVIFAVQAIVLMATLWVRAGYVSRSEFDTYKQLRDSERDKVGSDLRSIATELAKLNEHSLGDAEQNRRLNDAEKRLNELQRDMLQQQHRPHE